MLGSALLGLGVACVIRETELDKIFLIEDFVNIGAFAAAGV
jgi:hypothetical protein